MHYVYLLRSISDDGFYIGYSTNLRKRFEQHAKGDAFATSYRGPWRLIYYEAYPEEADALGRERCLKSGAGRRFLEAQLAQYLGKNPIRSAQRFRPSGLHRAISDEAA
jgi:putative endonuclease